jgi:[protein-PII] uridylyltransferase
MTDLAFIDYMQTFAASMPPRYGLRYDAAAIADHAQVAYRRGRASAAVGTFRWQRERRAGLPLVVVAEDRPGLLSKISAALVLSALDVSEADAYTRRDRCTREAVDLFWVRRASARSKPPSSEQIARFRTLLVALLDGAHDVSSLARVHPLQPQRAPDPSLRVRALCAANGWLEALEVAAADRPGLLAAISRALFVLGLQIAGCEARTVDGRVRDRFSVEELDGAPVSPQRAADLVRELPALLGLPAAASAARRRAL